MPRPDLLLRDAETMQDAADRIGMSQGSIRLAVERGDIIPARVMGGYKLLDPLDVDAWFASDRPKPGRPPAKKDPWEE